MCKVGGLGAGMWGRPAMGEWEAESGENPVSERLTNNVHESFDSQLRFGSRLREAREKKGLTQMQLSAASGYTNGWISNIERGDGTPTSTFARRMEVILGCDLEFSRVVFRAPRGALNAGEMTATEVAGFVGLSRTRIYELMRRDKNDPRFLPWKSVEGFRRVLIADLAIWVVNDGIYRRELIEENREEEVNRKYQEICNWLEQRRAYAQKQEPTPVRESELDTIDEDAVAGDKLNM